MTLSDYPILAVSLALTERSFAIWASLHAVLKKQETRAVIGWVGLIWLSPLVGSILYYLFGINRIERRGEKILNKIKESACDQARKSCQAADLNLTPFRFNQQLANIGKSITGFDLLPGNKITPLNKGACAYAAMLDAIRNASSTIGLCSYIFDYDKAGRQFIDALVEAQERGVEVRVLVDHVGSRYSKPTSVKIMQERGLKVTTFLPTNVPVLAAYANLRNHRKILVVDGMVGFTGGMNIREGCLEEPGSTYPVQDIHFQFDGPVVDHLQDAFLADWEFAANEELSSEKWFQMTPALGETWARGIPDGPDADIDNIKLVMLGAISSARRSVDIVTPYFIPEEELVSALNIAAMRGVDVRILVPSAVNIRAVQWASMDPIGRILQRGCKVFQSPPPFDHTKVMLVDGEWSLVGSSNWDPRSLRLNFEFNVECYGKELNSQLSELIEEKIALSREMTTEDLAARSSMAKLRDGIARLATPYL
ncbi:cardiolipin synthase [Thalassoglobus polymorphus]|uniref:Cardiolipin synthase n=1 Tax=Thalassoglobus polymorphus TaxID=2527994 RepID=A0A517QQD8_9PLAN|nr:cardiolipin synthase [Thalassoglobus polymorphus]QDT33834.1 Major cardiolipin synthase ClsA [Thalassoglobus polymorphus]